MISDPRDTRPVDKAKHPDNIVQFFRRSPLFGVRLNLERSRESSRIVEGFSRRKRNKKARAAR